MTAPAPVDPAERPDQQPPRIDYGRRYKTLAIGSLRFRIDGRTVALTGIIVALVVALALLALALGAVRIQIPQVVETILGGGTARTRLVVLEWRMPRVLAAVVFGAALGASGAIFQALTRNSLGSPDIIGFSSGAYTGGIVTIILFGGGYLATAAGATVGGLLTALVVFVLAYRGGVEGFRLIIVGIGIAAMLGALNTWLLLRAELEVAMAAAAWGAGSLNAIGWSQTWPAIVLILICFALFLAVRGAGEQLELGDDAAQALGVRVTPTRIALIALGVVLVAATVAAAGPISFIALVAPQIGRRLARASSVPVLPGALTGAALLLIADLISQHLLPMGQLPVGIVTVALGGVYLIYLLIHEARRSV